MDMQVKWQNKKKDGNFSADGIKSASEWAEEQKNKMREMTGKTENNESSDITDKDDYKDKILKSINLQFSFCIWYMANMSYCQ